MAWRGILDDAWFVVSCGIWAVFAVFFLVIAIVALGIDLATMHRRKRCDS